MTEEDIDYNREEIVKQYKHISDAFKSLKMMIELMKIEQAKTAAHDALLRFLVINNPNREDMTNAYASLIEKYSQSSEVDKILLTELQNIMKWLPKDSKPDPDFLHNLGRLH